MQKYFFVGAMGASVVCRWILVFSEILVKKLHLRHCHSRTTLSFPHDIVIPAKAGIHTLCNVLPTNLRRTLVQSLRLYWPSAGPHCAQKVSLSDASATSQLWPLRLVALRAQRTSSWITKIQETPWTCACLLAKAQSLLDPETKVALVRLKQF